MINEDSADHLDNIINGGLMRKITPDDIASQFLDSGYIRRATGGYVPTKEGHQAFLEWQKGNVK